MSDGDEAEDAEADDERAADLDPETLADRLDEARTALDEATTEADLDDVEATLETLAADLEAADLPEEDDEDGEGLTERLDSLEADLDAARGPYAADVIATVDGVQETLRETRWTETGESDLVSVGAEFTTAVADAIDAALEAPTGDSEALADGLESVTHAVDDADLDPDDDAETLEDLVEAGQTLEEGVEAAEEWDDLTVRAKLEAEGFYDALGGKYKDFPPEWSALKVWEREGNVEMILTALDRFDSDFMERHCLESLERMGPPEATETVLGLAERRDQRAIRILGKIGDPQEEVVETLVDYLEPGADPALERVTLKALGEMGARSAVQDVANRLGAESPAVRTVAARALGLVGDPRAIEPLESVLAEDDDDGVRASAAWALIQIGTEDALSIAATYDDDRAYVVQSEAARASAALEDADAPAA
jgi:hypothetical protein